jgi:predicted small metal-binding protein
MPHQFSCSECSFQVQSDDQNEIVDVVREHAEGKHSMNVSDGDIRGGMETV